jgi:hypothetical protein
VTEGPHERIQEEIALTDDTDKPASLIQDRQMANPLVPHDRVGDG